VQSIPERFLARETVPDALHALHPVHGIAGVPASEQVQGFVERVVRMSADKAAGEAFGGGDVVEDAEDVQQFSQRGQEVVRPGFRVEAGEKFGGVT